ncbi:uncharacterized protein PGTG_04468 [Puccinia graminis f. sp. tritici CRL 75-36-700-3]|uniref:Uncharacterized protein n=1 Tax=Puccinia graminis f. sp. tritici (strain CRL 75-36-700-3 / race SCCL) TaxID=418459 RepID=E3K2E3_PUCGT|nr:uncharacterized protein PGTG_04468 [Puccinia graminis f. sp. tritici CRL 75-36-700-3]EFP78512.1 hypothetical protein PGTG_04468 [Puccinia graminis f. sp. tritici CRL 75-36-700-3]
MVLKIGLVFTNEDVDYVIQQITSSLAKQAKFNTWAKKLNYSGPTLIAGYGIRWNIKFESHERGYITQNIINKLIENKRDREDQKGGKNHFNKYKITQSNWDIVKKLNDIISALNDQAARDEDTPPPTPKKNTTLAPGGGLEEDVNFFFDAAPETHDKLAVYLGVVALLAQDYLAASVEQCFLAGADVCGQD